MKYRVCLAYSILDPAGSGIAHELLKNLDSRPLKLGRAAKAYYLPQLDAVLAGYEEDVLYFEFLDKVVDASFYLILSRHKSEAGIKAFTVHHPGNPYREAKAGGKPLELPPSNPPLAKALLLSLRDARERMELEEFDVTYEVTHHGPTSLRKPVTFVEIGSSEREWIRQDARRAVAEAVIEALEHTAIECEPVVGVGGNHYASKFTARALATSEAYGHMIAKYALKSLTEPALIEEVLTTAALRSSIPTVKLVVEKKLRRAWREAAMRTAEKLGLQVEFV